MKLLVSKSILAFGLMVSVLFFMLSVHEAGAIRGRSTVWYLRTDTASSTFGTTGPTAEYATMSDLVSGSPTNKTTALAMTEDAGTSQASVSGTETSASAGNIWFRTYLSPKLAAQTIADSTTLRFEASFLETSASANFAYKVHVYVWREGTGYVASLFDGSSIVCGGEPTAANSNRSQMCNMTSGPGLDLEDGDQIALEVWIYANNISATSFTGTHYLEGTEFVGNGTGHRVITSSRSSFGIGQALLLQDYSDYSTLWYLLGNTAASLYGTDGPAGEQSASSDGVPSLPASKTTIKSLANNPGTGQTSIQTTETSASQQTIWMGTFLSQRMEAQTIPSGTTFRFEGSGTENGTLANYLLRLHMFVWREGTGLVSSIIDNVASTNCGAEPSITQVSIVCVTAALGSGVSMQAGDQLGLEVWYYSNNTAVTSFNGTFQYGGTDFIENGGVQHAVSSAKSVLASSYNFELLTTLTLDIIDENDASVASPSVSFSAASPSTTSQTTTATLGSATERIFVDNLDTSESWSVSFAPTGGSNAAWTNGQYSYDFNDASDGTDGVDADSLGGRLSVDPTASTITALYGCSNTTGLSKGSSTSFAEGSVDSITLFTADSTSSVNCAWEMTGVGLSQVIPANQLGGNPYTLGLTLSIL